MCDSSVDGGSFFFFNDTATTEIYTLSLHDALPILGGERPRDQHPALLPAGERGDRLLHAVGEAHGGDGLADGGPVGDRKSTRLNSSHANISYAVFCLKKKKKHQIHSIPREHCRSTI